MNDLILQDAREYGLHVKGGDWRLGLLVARNVEKGAGQNDGLQRGKTPANPRSAADRQTGKISLADFAKLAGVGKDRARNHLDGWEKAAEAGLVPAAATLNPGDEVKLDREVIGEFSAFYTPVSGGYNGGADRTPTVGNIKSGLDKLTPSERGEILADLVGDDQAFAEAPTLAKQELAGKLAEMFSTAKVVGKKKLNEISNDSHGWNHVQFAISDAAAQVARATSEALHLQHGSDLADDRSMLGVAAALSRLETNTHEFKTLVGIKQEV